MTEMITASRLATFRTCARLHELRYDRRVERVRDDNGPRRWGTAFHKALEAYFIAWLLGADPLVAALQALDLATELDPFERARAVVSLHGYHARWGDEPWIVLAVEAEFEAPLVNPDSLAASRTFTVAGKIDAIIQGPDGMAYIVEHKTSTDDIDPGSPYWQRLRLDAQVSIYLDGARALGHEPAGCVYDVIARPLHQPRLATPAEARKFTKGKGCKDCGGRAAEKDGVHQGTGQVHVTGDEGGLERYEQHHPCSACTGTGWIDAPRLHTNQRDTDETVKEFADRIATDIAADPGAYYQRGIVVRTGDEMTDARREIWRSAKLLRFAQREDCQPRNPAACAPFRGSVCSFFDLCSGAASVDGTTYRIRESAHPELTASTQTPREGAA